MVVLIVNHFCAVMEHHYIYSSAIHRYQCKVLYYKYLFYYKYCLYLNIFFIFLL